jgi:hypothetical protein
VTGAGDSLGDGGIGIGVRCSPVDFPPEGSGRRGITFCRRVRFALVAGMRGFRGRAVMSATCPEGAAVVDGGVGASAT